MRKHIFLTIFLLSFMVACIAQVTPEEELRISELEQRLDAYAMSYPKIKSKKVDVDVNTTLDDFAIAVTRESKVSMTIHPDVKGSINISLSQAPIKDILLHLCKLYSLTLDFSGSIISLQPYKAPKKKVPPKVPGVKYTAFSDRLELNLKRDTLDMVLGEISRQSGKNVIASSDVSEKMVGGFIGSSKFSDALTQLAVRNDLELEKDERGFWVFRKKEVAATQPKNNKGKNNSKGATISSGYVKVTTKRDTLNNDLISIESDDGQLSEIIRDVSNRTGIDYYLYTDMKETVSIRIKDASYEGFLDKILQGTKYQYHNDRGVYMIGDTQEDNLLEARVIQLQHRSVNEILKSLPDDLAKKDVKIKEFKDLNALLVSGSSLQIGKLEEFVNEIDRPVPVVAIELLIVDVNRTRNTRAGVDAGVGPAPVQAGGQLFPGVDFTFSSKGVNQLLGWLAGNGIVNLGQVAPNFYLNLQAIENSGVVNVRQKPRLSTLNGQEATFSNGEKRYYLEETTTLQGTLSPTAQVQQSYKEAKADFTIKITPFVSGDENVTMDISIDQSSFVGQLLPNAPPPTVNRKIESSIRVKNGEMIVLGGLESIAREDSGSGVPLLQRIPVIKWFFSKRTKSRTKTKLLVFVKPTVIYE